MKNNDSVSSVGLEQHGLGKQLKAKRTEMSVNCLSNFICLQRSLMSFSIKLGNFNTGFHNWRRAL